ncbi:DUF4267 domain-containing protein [Glycomyces terrestris]|uniref:DUF4267 domain-containing protein n=1 Tax=Glycomyces terrestris TaxID=2493553 RepID=A0A426V300_9ACTN|nr:DUF4267 domain-containing protein [Glycomyces terrestris]RRS01284.1 DUF4267 domain-containing protein [Glycomyces terrestris]
MDASTFAALADLAAIALGAAFVCLGAAGVLAPQRASRAYGIPAATPETRAWAAAAAWRDIAAGAAVLAAAWTSSGLTTGLVLFALALIPLGDMATLARHGIRTPRSHLPHAAGFAAVAAVAAALVAL